MKSGREYEVKVAMSTMPKGYHPARYIDPDHWYRVVPDSITNFKRGGPYFWIEHEGNEKWVYTSLKDSGHLAGGSWKYRRVKNVDTSSK